MFLILCDAEKKNCLKILRKVSEGLEDRVEGFGHREAGSQNWVYRDYLSSLGQGLVWEIKCAGETL
jgi:hypothetical protein